MLIQVCAVVLVVSYYRFPGLQEAARSASNVKLRYGVWFAFAIGTLAGGLVPETAKLLTGTLRRFDGAWVRDTLYNALVYGLVGAQVDFMYRFQAYAFGPTHSVQTLVVKTLVDMAGFAPVISIPTATVLYALRRERFRVGELVRSGVRPFYIHQVVPGLIPCWFFWTPVLLCTYAMPDNLQLCFSMLAEAAWSIVFVLIAKQDHAPPP